MNYIPHVDAYAELHLFLLRDGTVPLFYSILKLWGTYHCFNPTLELRKD
jgi:hypothetical protein